MLPRDSHSDYEKSHTYPISTLNKDHSEINPLHQIMPMKKIVASKPWLQHFHNSFATLNFKVKDIVAHWLGFPKTERTLETLLSGERRHA